MSAVFKDHLPVGLVIGAGFGMAIGLSLFLPYYGLEMASDDWLRHLSRHLTALFGIILAWVLFDAGAPRIRVRSFSGSI